MSPTLDVRTPFPLCAVTQLHIAEAMLPMFHTQLPALRAALPAIAPLRHALLQFHHPLDKAAAAIAYEDSANGGGSLFALGCYPVAVAQALFGRLEPLLATATVDAAIPGCDLSFTAVVCAPECGGATVTLTCAMAPGVPRQQGLTIVGAGGSIVSDSPFPPKLDASESIYVTLHGDGSSGSGVGSGAGTKVSFPVACGFEREIGAFEETALRGAPAVYGMEASATAAGAVSAALRRATLALTARTSCPWRYPRWSWVFE